MGIRFTKYIRIVSGVIGQLSVNDANFCLRLFTNNPFVPVGTVGEFDTLAEVGAYFGTSSAEYLQAAPYFGFVSKQIAQPDRIQFARWVDTAQAATIYGNTAAKLLATLTAISAGGFTLTIGGVPLVATALNLSGAADLAAVAALVQTKVRTGSGTPFTAATVTYDPTTNRFILTAGNTATAAISITDGAQGPAAALGWTTGTGLIVSPGSAIEAPEAAFNNSVAYNDNFGSFNYMPAISLAQATAIANANKAINNQYLFCLDIATANAASWQAAMGAIGGVAATLSPIATEYPELLPAAIFAATDFGRPAAAQNYMYQVAGNLTPSVTDTTSSDTYDALNINYYGQTKKNGQNINFYQRGILWGGVTDVRDIGPYVNEIWFKSAMGTMLINLLIAVTQIPASDQGRRMLLANSNPVIQQAITNSTIEAGKVLNATQKAAIFQATNDPLAFVQVQSLGYWLDWTIAPVVVNGIQEYQAQYTLVYSKADSIRTITGAHALV